MNTLHVDTGREMRGGQWQVSYLLGQLPNATLLVPPDASLGRLASVDAEPLSLIALARLARQVDLIHAHTARAHSMAAIAGGAPLVVSRRVGFPVKRSIVSRWKYRRPEVYLAVSRFVAAQLIHAGVDESMIRVVYDGVPIPPKTSTLEPGRVIALASKPAEIPGIPIHLTTDLWQDLSTASVFVYRSEMEGLGSAALAAMAAGVPVVASNVGGLPEAVEDERTGLLVRNGDFTTPVRRLLDHPAEAAEMGRCGRERVENNFTIPLMVEKTLAAYKEVLG